MRACQVWLDRDYLLRAAAEPGGEVLSATAARLPSGRLVELPAPCGHSADDCPPHQAAARPVGVAA